MSEPDKQTVRQRAFEVVRDYRDRGCPPPFIPDEQQLRVMLNVMTAGQVTDEFIDYIAADLRLTDVDQNGPVLASTAEQRAGFPVVVIGCGESGLLAGIKLKQAGIPFTIIDKTVRGRRHLAGQPLPGVPRRHRQPVLRVLVRAHRPLAPPLRHPAGDPAVSQRRDGALRDRRARPVRHRGDRRCVGRGERHVASADPGRHRRVRDADRSRADLCGRPVQQPGDPGHQGRQRFRRPVVSHRRLGRHRRPGRKARRRHRSRRQRISSSSRRSRTPPPTSTSTSAPRSGWRPTSTTTHGSASGAQWATRRLPYYGAVAAVRDVVADRRRTQRADHHRPRVGQRWIVGQRRPIT